MQESRALFRSDLLVCYARMSCFVSSIDCLLVTRESCAQFLSQLAFLLHKNLAYSFFPGFVSLLCKNIVHYFFCSLLVCYARTSCIVCSGLLVNYARISCSVFFLQFGCLLRKNLVHYLFWFVSLLRKNLVHCFFCSLLFCYVRISSPISSKFARLLRKNLADCLFWFVTPGSRALFLLQFACLLRKNLALCFFCSLLVCYARISRAISFVVCLSVTQESRALFLLQFAYLLRQNLAHRFFFDLLVCYARISCIVTCVNCLSITRESRAKFIPWIGWSVVQESRALPFSQFAFLLRKNLAHCFFCSLLVCYARILGTDCFWFVDLLGKSLMHFSFFSLLVCYARISRFVSSAVCLSVTQESRALFLLQFVYQLRKNLVHCFFCSLHVCYARISGTDCFWFVGLLRKSLVHFSFFSWLVCYAKISRSVSSAVCLSVTRKSRALFLLQFVCLSCENLAHNLFPGFVGLLCKNLAHCLFLSLLFCYARISRTVSSVVFLSVTQESRAMFLLQFACLLRKNLTHCFCQQFSCLLRKNLAHSRFVLSPVV